VTSGRSSCRSRNFWLATLASLLLGTLGCAAERIASLRPQAGHPCPVTVEIHPENGPRPGLGIALTNRSQETWKTLAVALPWYDSMDVTATRTDNFRIPLDSPIHRVGDMDDVELQPGETLRGTYYFDDHLSGFRRHISESDIVITWKYAFSVDDDSCPAVTGRALFRRRPEEAGQAQ